MKKILSYFVVALCMILMVTPVYAETGSYTYKSITYCFKQDGTYARQVNVRDTSCSGLYGGTVYKQINGEDAYCTQGKTSMSTGSSCTSTNYNQYSWMNGNWTETNAVKMGYLIQYIRSKGYSKAVEYVYIVNGSQNVLGFQNSFAKRTLNSDIQGAINYANEKASNYKKVSTSKPVSAAFANTTLTNVNNSYAKGEINVSITNGSSDANVKVSAKCNNCTLYTDSNLTKTYSGTTVKASGSQNLKLYVKTNGYTENESISVTFTANYDKITYPIGKLWNCGTNKQALLTLSSTTYQIPSASVTAIAKVPAIKRTCEIYNGKYYGTNGSVISKDEYIEQCEKPVCKVVDNKYYGTNGKVVTEDEYIEQCEKPVCQVRNGKYYGKNGTIVTEDEYVEQCEKPVCKIVNNRYFGENGTIVTEDEYVEQCEKPVCKVVNDRYFGKNGTVVSKDEYKAQCEPSQEVVVPSTGTNKSSIPYVLGSILVVVGAGYVIRLKKKVNNQ